MEVKKQYLAAICNKFKIKSLRKKQKEILKKWKWILAKVSYLFHIVFH